jgi:hypothetical protein
MIKSLFLLITLFCIAGRSSAQEYLGMDKESVIWRYTNSTDTAYQVTLSDTIVHEDSADHLGVVIEGFEKIKIDYFFDDFAGDCDSIVIQYYCNACVDKHIEEILWNRRWVKLDDKHYIARHNKTKMVVMPKGEKRIKTVGSTQVKIERKAAGEPYAVVTYSVPMMSKQEWKKLVKKK